MHKDSGIKRTFMRTRVISALSVAGVALVLQLFGTKEGFCDVGTQHVDTGSPVKAGSLPNIIIINTDDLGFGDLGCNVATP